MDWERKPLRPVEEVGRRAYEHLQSPSRLLLLQGIQGISCLTWPPGKAVATGSPDVTSAPVRQPVWV